jgi:Protein of unknown function (DUF2934)
VKTPKALNQDKARSEGHTQLELAAELRRRAYRLYEERGRADGHALEDWLQAEADQARPTAA